MLPRQLHEDAMCMQAATDRIASFLTASGNSAKSGAASTTNGQATSFQQALPSVSVPTTFTHETFSGDGAASSAAGSTSGNLAGRKLKQVLTLLEMPVVACLVNRPVVQHHNGLGQLLLSGRGSLSRNEPSMPPSEDMALPKAMLWGPL